MSTLDEKTFFALDIGTRSVIGILGNYIDDVVHIKHIQIEYHKKRAMFDGQVHDIGAVSDIVKKVKTKLEEKSGIKLNSVAIAAAGRALKTIRTTTSMKMEMEHTVDAKDIKQLNIKGLQEASEELEKKLDRRSQFLNVGHTIMTYKLDDMELTNPLGHIGQVLSLDVIATFLPRSVIDALTSVMKNVELEISYISLEPIVAIEVAVPENVRLLNIAMVDVGAGTSDIAITKDGVIIGYEMTDTAGDEITEALTQKYLLDFDTAEKLKCNLNISDNQKFVDIVGISHEMSTEEILDDIEQSIELVSKKIADGIIKANDKAPSAVFMVGGGCQVPRMKEAVAKFLELPESRVAIKDISMVSNIEYDEEILQGPQSITPVGILVSSCKNEESSFIEVFVNDEKIRLFRSTELKVADALIVAGVDPKELIGKKGKSILVKVNGNKRVFNGKFGQEADIQVNGQKASLDTKISDADSIVIKPAIQGSDANVLIEDIVSENTVLVDTAKTPIYYDVKINGQRVYSLDRKLENGDEIDYEVLSNLEELIQIYELNPDSIYEINGDVSKISTMIKPGDKIKIYEKNSIKFKEKEKKQLHTINIVCNSKLITVTKDSDDFLLVDVFDFIDFDRTKSQGKLVTKINGEDASFTSKIKNSDNVEIYWEKI